MIEPLEQINTTPPELHVLVLGGGSAGLLAALTVKRMMPGTRVEMVRSKEIGVIGVGEGTTAVFPAHLFQTLGIPMERFYRQAKPTWKQGIRFLWGPRGDYFYDFGFQYDLKFPGMDLATGYYCEEDCHDLNEVCSMMRSGKAFLAGPLNKPLIKGEYAFHIENALLVECMEAIAEESGISIVDDTLVDSELDENGVKRLHFESGISRSADLYIDASGFRSELLGKALAEPFQSFSRGLFCDRAVIGGWERGEEPLVAYTTAETMNSGWCWQIEHEHFINRGYVYSSGFISDEAALEEFLRCNPKVSTNPRVVKYRSGRYARNWVKNVVAIGNSSGFVEPLEATALAQIIYECRWLCVTLQNQSVPRAKAIEEYNLMMGRAWDEIRDFLAFHYKFNTLRDTEYWRHCWEHTSLGDFTSLYEAYRVHGPGPELIRSLPYTPNIYGIEGYLAHLVGMRVPYQKRHSISPQEQQLWEQQRQRIRTRAATALTVKQTLQAIRQPHWSW